MTGHRGFSLLEMAVATLLLSVAAAGLLGAIGESLAAARSARDREAAIELSRTAMNEILTTRPLPLGEQARVSSDGQSGWVASVRLDDRFRADARGRRLLHIRLEVWWLAEGELKTTALETYRRSEGR